MSDGEAEQKETEIPKEFHAVFVDDEGPIREMAGLMLRDIFSSVKVCPTPQEVLAYFRKVDRPSEEKQPNVLITDLRMPGMTGLELAKAVKSEFPSTSIVLTTSGLDESIDLKKAGIDIYLEKPYQRVQLQELPEKIRQKLQTSSNSS